MTDPAYVVMPTHPADQRWLTYDDRGPLATGYPYLTDMQAQARMFPTRQMAEQHVEHTAYGIRLPPLHVVAVDLAPRPIERF